MSSETLVVTPKPQTSTGHWRRVTLTGILAGEPPKVGFFSVLTLPNGEKKPCPGTALVTDPQLLQRLRTEVKLGDAIRIRIKTDWDAEGIPVTLNDFCRI